MLVSLLTVYLKDQKLIDSYRTETDTKLKQVEALSDPDHPRVFHVTQCTACKGQLDLPSVHFMCNHSYHQRYVSIGVIMELVLTQPALAVLVNMIRNVPTVLVLMA